MADSVKFIFLTLIKVPIIIFIAYGILNLFAFCFIYFKMLGVSYVVMQTAVENNYLPASELNTLYTYVDSFNNISMVENATIIVGGTGLDTSNPNYAVMSNSGDTAATIPDNGTNSSDARSKKQYGRTVTVGVTCDYKFIWPLMPNKVQGMGSTTPPQTNTGRVTANNDITIVYTVPGLRYYPDLHS